MTNHFRLANRTVFAIAVATLLSAGVYAEEHDEPKDIVDTAVAAGTFTTLAAALEAGELVEALKSEGPFTVFAPTDEAFAALPEGTVESLLEPENKEQLVAILTYHVVSGKVLAAEVVELEEVTTLNGAKLAVDTEEGVKVGTATVVATDIEAKNGVIHVIDSVLLPPTE